MSKRNKTPDKQASSNTRKEYLSKTWGQFSEDLKLYPGPEIHEENTKEIMSVKESVYSDTEFC